MPTVSWKVIGSIIVVIAAVGVLYYVSAYGRPCGGGKVQYPACPFGYKCEATETDSDCPAYAPPDCGSGGQCVFGIDTSERIEIDPSSLDRHAQPPPPNSIPTPQPVTTPRVTDTIHSCDFAGATFSSVGEYEMGLGPDGPIKGHWQIWFTNSTYTWRYSDVGSSGTYICVNNVLTFTPTPPKGASYDSTHDLLIWDGIVYARAR